MAVHLQKVSKEYSRLATRYDQRWSFYVQASIEETLRRVELPSRGTVLDVGCGTGALLARLSEARELSLLGMDPVREMLEVARARVSENASLLQGSAEALPFADTSIEMLISTSVFHYFGKPAEALREFARVLKPNGSLVITDWCHDFLPCKILDRYLRLTNSAHFKTWTGVELVELLERIGFHEVRIERYKINWLWGLMTVQCRNRP